MLRTVQHLRALYRVQFQSVHSKGRAQHRVVVILEHIHDAVVALGQAEVEVQFVDQCLLYRRLEYPRICE